MNDSRFSFPGATLVDTMDTSTHEIEVIEIKKEDGNVFLCDMIRRSGLSFGGDFLVASVKDAKKNVLWKFADVNHTGLGLLASTTEGAVIALVGSGKSGSVERVIPLGGLVRHEQSDVARLLQMKQEAAEYLGRDFVLTGVESRMFSILNERRRAAEASAKARAEEEKRRAREERVRVILDRLPLKVRTADNEERSGIPVVEAEWPMLPHGTHVVLVTRIGEDGENGDPVSAFWVRKVAGRNPQREAVVYVGQHRPLDPEVSEQAPKPVRSVLAERDGTFHEVHLYTSMDTIRRARTAGLNGGTLVAVNPEAQTETSIEVFAVRTGEVQTLGKYVIV